jgi:hypothetical protein
VEGERVLSAYAIDESKPAKGYGENCLWIITERDRSVTARRSTSFWVPSSASRHRTPRFVCF